MVASHNTASATQPHHLSPLSDACKGGRSRAEVLLLDVELDGAADGGVEIRAGPPPEIALRRMDGGHPHLDVLVVLAVVVAGRDLDDLRRAGAVAQHRKLLRDADGASGELADRDAVRGAADVEDAARGASLGVLEDGEQALDRIVDIGERALLLPAIDQLDRPAIEDIREELREDARAALLRLLDVVEVRADEIEGTKERVVEIVAHAIGVDHTVEELLGGRVDPALLLDRAI